VIGPDGKYVEIQIRTLLMHEESERGVAAHWLYKEGSHSPVDDRTKMAYLQQLISWHQEVANADKAVDSKRNSLSEDRIYVITPAGDILDLPQGSTPIDFAYHIHSDIGHRCRGAKVNGHIVPLTYSLCTGNKVDIHTVAEGGPSRDWLNSDLGFTKTARAKSKITHWFKQQALHQNITEGRQLKSLEKTNPSPTFIANSKSPIETHTRSAIAGAADLLTRPAKCCKPIPGEAIIGYITQASGISIHKKNCSNVAHLTNTNRFINVAWDSNKTNTFITDLKIMAHDREKVLHDLTALFVQEKIKLLNLNVNTKKDQGKMAILTTLQIQNIDQLEHIKQRILQLSSVIEVMRVKK
jgi:GTP pyrophosphokinase